MKFAHVRVSEHFTLREQVFHSEAISLARRANFVKKREQVFRLAFVLEAPPGFEPGRKGFADLCLTTWLWCLI